MLLGGAKFYKIPFQYEYLKHTQLTIDVVPGMGGMSSLENGSGSLCLIRSRVFTDAGQAARSESA